MSDIVEAWMWRDPGEIIDDLLRRSARIERRGEAISMRVVEQRPERDRYYTQARRLHVKQLMRVRK